MPRPAATDWGEWDVNLQGRVRDTDWRPGLRKTYWEVSWLTMSGGGAGAESSAARVMLLAYGVMAVVLVSCTGQRDCGSQLECKEAL